MPTNLQKLVEDEKIKVRQEAQRKLAEEHLETWNMAVEACIEQVKKNDPQWGNNVSKAYWGHQLLLALEELKKHEN